MRPSIIANAFLPECRRCDDPTKRPPRPTRRRRRRPRRVARLKWRRCRTWARSFCASILLDSPRLSFLSALSKHSRRRGGSRSARHGAASCSSSGGSCARSIQDRSEPGSRNGATRPIARKRACIRSSAGASACSRMRAGSTISPPNFRTRIAPHSARSLSSHIGSTSAAPRRARIANCSVRSLRSSVTVSEPQPLLIGLVSISDRASAGVYEDKGIPGLTDWFAAALKTPWRMETRLIPDEQPTIERTLIELVDTVGCDLVFTTGGNGPAPRDVTPEATLAVAHRVLPGFGEQMRQVSLKYVPTAILSRQVGAVRGRALVLNLPGRTVHHAPPDEGPLRFASTVSTRPNQPPPFEGRNLYLTDPALQGAVAR